MTPSPSAGDGRTGLGGYTVHMTYGGPSEPEAPRSLIRASSVWRRPETSARAELVWNADVPSLRTADVEPVTPVLAAETEEIAETVEMTETMEVPAIEADPVPQPVADVVRVDDDIASEVARRRQEALEQLDSELRARRAELSHSLERQRTVSEQRIAEIERLETAALARRREETLRSWRSDESRVLAEQIDAAFATQLADLKDRYADAEARLRQHVETRQHEEATRLEQWRAGERERIEAELAAEERRFNERLLRHLQEFEHQLAERAREQEERLARAWGEAEERAKRQLAAIFSSSGV